ncbi:MAG: endonuclease G [Brevundimonas sp.]|jgi:endonuclease G|uniref:DNA/RNA non-specific endonuclease n=1 Tax=Brevundimonas sp. TaxID=1871086 RepID=UPI0039E4E000
MTVEDEESAARAARLIENRALYEAVQEKLGESGKKMVALEGAKNLSVPGDAARLLETRKGPPGLLEAIIRQVGRPPMEIRDGRIVWETPGELAFTRQQALQIAPLTESVGRIDFLNHDLTYGGTGWVLDTEGEDRLVVTNRHVAVSVCRRLADGRGVLARSPWNGARYGLEVDFNETPGSQPRRLARGTLVEAVFLAEDLQSDAALLRIGLMSGQRLPDPLPLADREAKRGEVVALVGYPAWDSRNDRTAMARYFKDLYDVKRFAPGLVMQSAKDGVITHDCTSLGGNSGSPLLSVEERKVVGLHFAGLYGVANSAVGRETLAELLRARRLVSVIHPERQGDDETRNDGRSSPEKLSGRAGFDPGFLGDGDLATPWPRLSAEMQAGLARPCDATEDRPNELRYTHFGVLFSETFGLPLMTAVNIDGEQTVRLKRGRDRWFFDGRIPEEVQFSSHAYDVRGIDRGHMVRREDPNWGPQAELANDDTFHLTNAAPQHSRFNQNSEQWLGLETYILESARTEGFRACVFTGPVHLPDDPPLEEDGMTVPLEFWKLAVMKAADGSGLHATAYLLSQGQLIRKLLEDRDRREAREGFRLGAFRTFQVSVADLGEALGYDFGPYVAADPFHRVQQSADETQAPVAREIRSAADMLL